MSGKQFLFMHPIEEHFSFHIDKSGCVFKDPKEGEKEAYFLPLIASAHSERAREALFSEARAERARAFRPYYSRMLNEQIGDLRSLGFNINYAVFDDDEVSPIVDVKERDRVIKVGMTHLEHTTQDSSGKYKYPSEDFILDQLGDPRVLVVGGFHKNSCVLKVVERARERGIDSEVHETIHEWMATHLWKQQRYDFLRDFPPE